MHGTQKGGGEGNDGNVIAESKKLRNNYAGLAGAKLCIIFVFWRQVGRREMHFSKNGDCV